jgi:hypothetical protein
MCRFVGRAENGDEIEDCDSGIALLGIQYAVNLLGQAGTRKGLYKQAKGVIEPSAMSDGVRCITGHEKDANFRAHAFNFIC